MADRSFADALRDAGRAWASATAMPYAVAKAFSAAAEWEAEIRRIRQAAASTYRMPPYLVDITIGRARHRYHTTPIGLLGALMTEWQHTTAWWWSGWHAAQQEHTP